MIVRIAGYNIDKSLIDKLETDLATPEVISAAYARISRSSKSVTELRKEAIKEIEKARKSNQNIIFEMGHSSIAEHAVFNIDLIGISRLLSDLVESIRFASFTEKSQRYVTLNTDYVLPSELNGEYLSREYTRFVEELFTEYQETYIKLLDWYGKSNHNLSKRDIEGKAKEDARYILPLATKTQLGLTINARSMENLLRRLSASGLLEAAKLHNSLSSQLGEICPSLIRYTRADDFLCLPHIQVPMNRESTLVMDAITIQEHSPNPEDKIMAAMLYPQSNINFDTCLQLVKQIPVSEKAELWQQVWHGMQAWHKVSRAFEYADCSFEAIMSESCWAQFKRHRVSSMLKSNVSLNTDPVIPHAIYEIGREAIWKEIWQRSLNLRTELETHTPGLENYLRLNMDRVKVLVKMNFREIYHFARLRSDIHAQWEIRDLSSNLTSKLKQIAPNAMQKLSGKSEFSQKN